MRFSMQNIEFGLQPHAINPIHKRAHHLQFVSIDIHLGIILKAFAFAHAIVLFVHIALDDLRRPVTLSQLLLQVL